MSSSHQLPWDGFPAACRNEAGKSRKTHKPKEVCTMRGVIRDVKGKMGPAAAVVDTQYSGEKSTEQHLNSRFLLSTEIISN